MQVMLELHTLLKVIINAYPEVQALLIDVQQYKPTWIVGGASAMLLELNFSNNATCEWGNEPYKLVDMNTMHCTDPVLGKVSFQPKARFVLP